MKANISEQGNFFVIVEDSIEGYAFKQWKLEKGDKSLTENV